MIYNSSFHCWRDPKRLVNAAKVVISEVQAKRCPVILEFLRERIRQARESADLHPHREVLALNNRSADAIRIGTADNWDHLDGLNGGCGITTLTFARSAVDLYKLREVYAMTKRIAYGAHVRAESISSDLETVSRL